MIGPADSSLGTKVDTATPIAVKHTMPTARASSRGSQSAGRTTPKPSLPMASSTATWRIETTAALASNAPKSTQVGSGLSRSRLSRPSSRRMTRAIARLV